MTKNSKIRRYVDGENLVGRLVCYHCWFSFPIPTKTDKNSLLVECPNCKSRERRDQYKCDEKDPLRHPLGWPYDDPTVPYDC
jgi:hypothetical protein